MGFANPLVGAAVNQPGQRFLFNGSVSVANAGTLVTTVRPALNCAGIAVQCTPGSALETIAVQVANTTVGVLSGPQIAFHPMGGAAGLGDPLFFPVPANAGDTITVTAWCPDNAGSVSATFIVNALSYPLPIGRLRADGRTRPRNTQQSVAAGTGPVTLIGAPPGNGRVMLGSVYIAPANAPPATEGGRLAATINGSAVFIASIVVLGIANPLNVVKEWPEGLLCDPSTALAFSVGGGAGLFDVMAFWDYSV